MTSSIIGSASPKSCSINIIVQNERQVYHVQDTITVLVKVFLDKDFCKEAADETKIFSKGLKIIERSDWKKISDTLVGQKLILTVQHKPVNRMLTVYRKTAHYNCFEQKKFKVEE